MTIPDETSYRSFIVRIWLEQAVDERGQALWRGYVIHVPSGEYRYFQKLEDLAAFIAPFLMDLGVPATQFDRNEHSDEVRKGGPTMAEIKWKLDLKVTDGPAFPLEKTMQVDAYERIDFELRPSYTRVIEIEPDPTIVLLLIKRDDPQAGDDKPDPSDLYYCVGDQSTQGKEDRDCYENDDRRVPLENVHVLVGTGVDQLLACKPGKLTFVNEQEQPVKITVLLGRNVDPAKQLGSSSTSTEQQAQTSAQQQSTSPGQQQY